MASSDTFKHLPRSEKLGSWLKLLITVVAACDASEKNESSNRNPFFPWILQWTKVWFSGSFIFDIFFQHISIMIGTCFFHFRGASPSGDKAMQLLGGKRRTSICLGMLAGDSLISRANPVNQNVDLGYQDIYIYILCIYICKKKLDMILGMSQGLRWFQPFNLEKKKQLYKCKVSRRNASSKHMVSTDLFYFGKFTTMFVYFMEISTRESMFTELMSDDVVVSFSSLKFQGVHFQIAMSFWLYLSAWCSPRKVACCIPHSGPNKFLLKDFWDPVASKKDPCVRIRTSNPSKTSMKHHETFPIPSKQHEIYI